MSNNDKIERAVAPDHYKEYINEYQWIDAMSRIPTMRDPVAFQGGLELQIRGYLDRRGQKDSDLQELKKARFYLQYFIAYLEGRTKNTTKSTAEMLQKAQAAFDASLEETQCFQRVLK